jgi:MoxR-like ATPase
MEYMLDMIHLTRQHPHVDIGVSPRGTLALMHAAQGVALIQDRDYVTPEDVKYIAPYILGHRIVLSIEGLTLSDQKTVIREIIEGTEVPVEYGVSRNEL